MSTMDRTDSQRCVLIAEENPTQARQLANILEAEGFKVASAPNGRVALDMARRDPPLMIVSDAMMPEMDGYELCAQIKNHAALADVPVILVTTLADPQDVIRGLECRADDFVLKPCDAENLARRIHFVLANSRNRRTDNPGKGLEIVFDGEKHFITADRPQILNLLLSTYEAAMQRNRELEQSNEALRQAQNALVQQERLRALGQMASGVAHDINNTISPISLYAEALLEREQLSDKARSYVATIQRVIDDVAQTVGRMREFYRPREQELQLADVELNPLIQQVADLTRPRWHDFAQQRGVMIELKPDLAADLATIRGAESEIRDALTNLILNAIDALPAGGGIRIRTRNVDGGVQLEVSDTGIGMDEETRRRCLEPFFTTKGDRGTGLGLAMVYGMAKRHSAGIDIDSAPGAGTTIRITFRTGTTQTSTTGKHSIPLFPTRSLRILLVDDDPALLESLRSALQDEGHKVTTRNGGQAGIEAFRNAQRGGMLFDVVITDLGMPYVDGRQVVASVRSLSPGTPIILLTGWGQHVHEQDRPLAVDRLLGKPPRIRELRTALAELTGRRATDRLG